MPSAATIIINFIRRKFDSNHKKHKIKKNKRAIGVNAAWTPITPTTQSRAQRTIFVNVIDCVVGAVMESI